MAQVTNFFAGANSGEGFRSLFSEMVDIEDTYDFMVLKGGPGVGKNTFMREIGRVMEEAGTAVEYLWCSGDPDSLDGVVLPELRCAVADGTSPHGVVSKGQFSQAGTRRSIWYTHFFSRSSFPPHPFRDRGRRGFVPASDDAPPKQMGIYPIAAFLRHSNPTVALS